MAAFYGTVKGNRGEASRTGSKDSGIETTAQSYDGSVNVRLCYGWSAYTDPLMVEIRIAEGSSAHGECVFSGTIDELREKLTA